MRIKTRPKHQGVALAMMLWFIAALALLVLGIVSISQTDVKMVQLQLQQTKASAAGDGASFLAMRDLLMLETEGEFKGKGILQRDYVVGGLNVRIKVVPTIGLIDLNRASTELLAEIFKNGAGMDEELAIEIAENIQKWRDVKPRIEDEELLRDYEDAGKIAPRYGRFEVPEDLMQVLGINRALYEQVSDLVVASRRGLLGVDPLSAPRNVLRVITGDEGVAQEIVDARLDTPFEDRGVAAEIPENYLARGVSSLFRLDADVTMEDGKMYRRRRWIRRGGGGQGRLPWGVVRSEPIVALAVVK